jgi:hypothetical protein
MILPAITAARCHQPDTNSISSSTPFLRNLDEVALGGEAVSLGTAIAASK